MGVLVKMVELAFSRKQKKAENSGQATAWFIMCLAAPVITCMISV